MKLRRKPQVFEAHVYDGTEKSVAEARLLLENKRKGSNLIYTRPADGSPGTLTVVSKGGRSLAAKKGDYIVRDAKGDLMPVTPAEVAEEFDVVGPQ